VSDMQAVGKVTAFVTRLGANGPEVCVFDHPRAGMQLPAGTLEPGEDIYAGARREAFEETGLGDLLFRSEVAVVAASRSGTAIVNRATYVGGRVIGAGYLARVLEHDPMQARIDVDGATGVVDLEVLSFDSVRHLVHFVIDGEAPDEWFVTSPDEAVTAGGPTGYRSTQRQHWTPTSRGGSIQRGAISSRLGTRPRGGGS
jgi:8-oxo-dGTP pyrophosphatase MutT (NUDIX family)